MGEFDGFEDDWKNTPAAEMRGRIPEGTYKFMLTAVNEGDDVLRDFKLLDNTQKGGSKGIKLYAEIIEPETMEVVTSTGAKEQMKVKGEILEILFWITVKNIPFVKRDIKTILGRELKSLNELTTITWAGKTFEGIVKEEKYNGFVNSRVKFYNEWRPQAAPKDTPKTLEDAPKVGAAKGDKPGEDVAF